MADSITTGLLDYLMPDYDPNALPTKQGTPMTALDLGKGVRDVAGQGWDIFKSSLASTGAPAEQAWEKGFKPIGQTLYDTTQDGTPEKQALTDFMEGAQLPVNETIASLPDFAKDYVENFGTGNKKPTTVEQMKAPNPGESPTETKVRGAVIESAVEKDPENNPETVKLLQEDPNAPVDKVVATKSKDGYNAGKKAIVQNGGTKEDLDAWDQFNENFDLTTIGLSLLMSNDGSRNMSQNMGIALQAGRQYKQDQKDKMTAEELAAAEAARKERETQVKEENAVSTRLSATAGAARDIANAENIPFENKIEGIKAYASMLRAQRTGMNDTSKVKLNKDMSEIQNYLQGADLMKGYEDLSQSEREAISEVGAYELEEVRKRSNGRLTPQQEIKLATEMALARGGRTKEAGFLGFGKERY